MVMTDITVTVEQLAMVVIGVASLLTSISVIWKHINKVKKTLDDRLESVIKEVVFENNTRQDERIKLMLENLKDMFTSETKSIEKRMMSYTEEYNKNRIEELHIIGLLKEGLLEAYKNDIRSVYYRLRDTGEISDADKSYIDKIFPKYAALGGNSDIHAKYEEICRVYERRTQEKYDEAFKNIKNTKNVKSQSEKQTLELNENK
jgi:hypothetical protein